MMKTGWWHVKLELTLEGEDVRWDDLDEATQEHIAECIKDGYTSGEIVIEEDNDYDGMTINCPDCGEEITIEFNTARCEECGWMCADGELDDIMSV